ncbi:pentatricopeptide repeat-containing protein, partial [Planoprotostelium fungivorum]
MPVNRSIVRSFNIPRPFSTETSTVTTESATTESATTENVTTENTPKESHTSSNIDISKILKSKRRTYEDFMNLLEALQSQEKLKALVNEMHRAGHTPSIKTYNELITLAVKQRNNKMIEYWMRNMRDNEVLADQVTFVNIIGYYAVLEDESGVEKWLQGMRKMNLSPDAITYSRVIKFYAHLKKTDKVEENFKQLKEEGLKANVSIYTQMIRYFTNVDMKRARSLIKEMRESGARLDSAAYTAVLKCAAKEKEVQWLVDTIEEMRGKGVQPTLQMRKMITKYVDVSKMDDLFEPLNAPVVRENVEGTTEKEETE